MYQQLNGNDDCTEPYITHWNIGTLHTDVLVQCTLHANVLTHAVPSTLPERGLVPRLGAQTAREQRDTHTTTANTALPDHLLPPPPSMVGMHRVGKGQTGVGQCNDCTNKDSVIIIK